MLNNLLDIIPGTGDKAGNYYFDNYGEPFLYALIGFVVVFIGIAILIAIIWLVGLLMRKTNNLEFLTNIGKNKAKKSEKIEPQKEEIQTSDEIPEEVKAAIVAAIMAYYQQEEGKCEFTVKRIKKI